jgi:hypothetical protein
MLRQIALRLPGDAYDELAKRAARDGRKVTPYLKQLLVDAAKAPPVKECIIVQPTGEMKRALVGIGKELGTTPGGVLLMAADFMLDALVGKAVDAREARRKASQKLESGTPRQTPRPKP